MATAPKIEDVQRAAEAFKAALRARVPNCPPDDKRSCKELLAHGHVQHKHNQLLVQAAEIIDDLLAVAPPPGPK